MKNMLFSKDQAIDKLDRVMRLQKKIMNEFTIYKLYFEMQKLKNILLDENQRAAFEVIKLDYGSLEKEARFLDWKSPAKHYQREGESFQRINFNQRAIQTTVGE